MSQISLSELSVGDVVATREVHFDRARLVRYAGASGDFNTIHWSDLVAERVGLPGVIAHGMLTMGAAVAVLTDWLGDPAAVVDYQTRFSRPIPVPAAGDVVVAVQVSVGAIDEGAGTVRFDLGVTLDGARILTKAQAVARLA